MTTMTKASKTTIRTEADGTTIADLQAWRRDDYGMFARDLDAGEQYEASVAELQARIENLQK